MAVLEATRLTGCNSLPSFIGSGNKMIFNMATSPTSWTKDTSPNSIMLRVVNGTASSGGSQTFPQVFTSSRPYSLSSTGPGSVSVTINPVTATYSGMPDTGKPAPSTSPNTVNTPNQAPHLHPYVRPNPPGTITRATNGSAAMIVPAGAAAANFQPIGGGGAHNHSIDLQHTHPFPTISAHNHQSSVSGSHAHPLSPGTISGFDLNYVDFIISSKN
jgi:hypothetical protein